MIFNTISRNVQNCNGRKYYWPCTKKGAVEICYHQIRDYANNKHNRVDDPPFGGGMGMLLRAEPLALCMDDVIKQLGKKPYFIYMSPLGSVLTQQKQSNFPKREYCHSLRAL